MLKTIKENIRQFVYSAIREAMREGDLPKASVPEWQLEIPREKKHGDFSSNVALLLARSLELSSFQIAQVITRYLPGSSSHTENNEQLVKSVKVAGPGFINFFLSNKPYYELLKKVYQEGSDYGSSRLGAGKKVLVEFVSANPTGPLNIVNARAAAFGDVLANVLAKAGYQVVREYYVNDMGNQVELFRRSVEIRYRQFLGEKISFPDDGYQGEYVLELAKNAFQKYGKRLLEYEEEKRTEIMREFSLVSIIEKQRRDLEDFGVHFDIWFRESQLHRKGRVNAVIEKLKEEGYTYEAEGAVWFKSSVLGDEKDRVLVRSDQESTTTYFPADLAYHQDKLERGFDWLINLWGPDHHGYVPRVKAGIKALGYDPDKLAVLIVQQVNVLQDGEKVKMSKREGKLVEMNALIQEVGVDAARFFFLMRRSDSHLDFDLELAKCTSAENPVYYVQYAHARICSIISFAIDQKIEQLAGNQIDWTLLKEEEELNLVKYLGTFPEVVEESAHLLEPHRLTVYLQELARLFHEFYTKHRVVSDNILLSQVRLALAKMVRTILNSGLEILGISAPQKM